MMGRWEVRGQEMPGEAGKPVGKKPAVGTWRAAMG